MALTWIYLTLTLSVPGCYVTGFRIRQMNRAYHTLSVFFHSVCHKKPLGCYPKALLSLVHCKKNKIRDSSTAHRGIKLKYSALTRP